MIAYSYDNNGHYIGEYHCQRDPIKSKQEGKNYYLLPADATFEKPPEYDLEAEIPVWNGETWAVEVLPDEPEPEPAPPEPTAEDITLDMLADHEERLCMLELTTL